MDHSSGTTQRHPVLVCAERLDAALKDIAGVDPVFMTGADKAEALVVLAGLADRVEELWLRVLATADDVAEQTGAPDAGAWLVPHALMDRSAAAASLRLAGALQHRWARVARGLREGEVSVAQARVICRGLDDLATAAADLRGEPAAGARTPDGAGGASAGEVGPEVLAKAEAELVRLAGRHTPAELRRLAERILSVVAPRVAEEHERRALAAAERRASAATRLAMRRRGDGSTDVRARIPDQLAARLRTYLDAYTSPRTKPHSGDPDHSSDSPPNRWAAVIDEATGERLPHDRRQGEAFCVLLEHLDPQRIPRHGGTATTLLVTIDLRALMTGLGAGTLADGSRISAGEARRLACGAGLIPAVLGGESQPLDLGRTGRLFSDGQKKLLRLRHAVCQAAGCTVPGTWCEAHHRTAWAAGGATDLDNAALLCPWHHHRAHDAAYRAEYLPDGGVRFHRRT